MIDNQLSDSIDLIGAVDRKIEKVRTRTLDLSFNELLDMYRDGELVINPDYQRLFRWSEGQQSRFIESIILEMPLPPIFVIERSEGEYELIDGLQRISSYLHFRGCLPNGEEQYLTLRDCDIVGELNGLNYETLPQALKIKLKRNFIRVEIIRKESDQRLRYYVFKRLNTGGEPLSEQEIRNCTIRLLNNNFNEFIIKLSQNEEFQFCISNLSDDKKSQKYDQELVLRFFSFKNYRGNYKHDVGDFMTEYMEAISEPEVSKIQFNYEEEKAIFEKTFRILKTTLAEYIFSRVNDKGTFVSGLSPYHFEAFTLGIQKHLNSIDCFDNSTIQKLKEEFNLIKKDDSFRSITTGGGKNTANQLQGRIRFVEERLESIL